MSETIKLVIFIGSLYAVAIAFIGWSIREARRTRAQRPVAIPMVTVSFDAKGFDKMREDLAALPEGTQLFARRQPAFACPQCGAPADNGYDQGDSNPAYMCKACCANEDAARLFDALSRYEMAFDSLFVHCCSNGVFNAWQRPFNCAGLNDAHEKAKDALSHYRTVSSSGKGQQ